MKFLQKANIIAKGAVILFSFSFYFHEKKKLRGKFNCSLAHTFR